MMLNLLEMLDDLLQQLNTNDFYRVSNRYEKSIFLSRWDMADPFLDNAILRDTVREFQRQVMTYRASWSM
ncbi:hypothetical protein P3L10_011946 [Capsicum annuum]